jgi:hypothetical protein
MSEKIVKLLYRHKLRIAANLGYKYGSKITPSSKQVLHNLDLHKIWRLNRRHKLGHYIASNVIYQYKSNMYEEDDKEIDTMVTDGFIILSCINEIQDIVKK